MISADTAIKTIIIVPVQQLVITVAGICCRSTGYVARKLNAVFRITRFCSTITMTATLAFAMVRTLLGSMKRTNTVVLVSVAKEKFTVLTNTGCIICVATTVIDVHMNVVMCTTPQVCILS